MISASALPDGMIAATEIAGPGLHQLPPGPGHPRPRDHARILREGADYGRGTSGAGQRVNVEFVSANPTGPLHVGHGRGAALGDAIAALLEWTGHAVVREFYVNDAGVQIDNLVASLWARILQQEGHAAALPEGGYHGDYLVDTAAAWTSDWDGPLPRVPRRPAAPGVARLRARRDARRAGRDAGALRGALRRGRLGAGRL